MAAIMNKCNNSLVLFFISFLVFSIHSVGNAICCNQTVSSTTNFEKVSAAFEKFPSEFSYLMEKLKEANSTATLQNYSYVCTTFIYNFVRFQVNTTQRSYIVFYDSIIDQNAENDDDSNYKVLVLSKPHINKVSDVNVNEIMLNNILYSMSIDKWLTSFPVGTDSFIELPNDGFEEPININAIIHKKTTKYPQTNTTNNNIVEEVTGGEQIIFNDNWKRNNMALNPSTSHKVMFELQTMGYNEDTKGTKVHEKPEEFTNRNGDSLNENSDSDGWYVENVNFEDAVDLGKPCNEGQQHVVKIKFGSLLPAIDDDVPKESLALLENLYPTLKSFHFEQYNTRGDMLLDIISEISNGLSDPDKKDKINRIAEHVRIIGPGLQSPKISLECENLV